FHRFYFLVLFLFPLIISAQTTFLPQGDKAYILADRLEIKAGKDSALNFSKTRPFSRRQFINGINDYVQRFGKNALSVVDAYNYRSALLNNLEYVPQGDLPLYKSRKPLAKNFYTTPANL